MSNICIKSLMVACFLIAISSCKQPQKTSDQNANISVQEALIKQGKPGVFFLDVRTPSEIENGKIEGALEIDFKAPDFKSKINQLDKSKEYVVYCRSGGRSSKTLDLMKSNGFMKVYNMSGGYSAWSSNKN